MAELPDLYGILGIPRGAPDDEIKRRYRQLARELHPDVNKDPDAERRFKEITAAYQTLSDPARRRQYDLFGSGQGMGPDLSPFGDFGDLRSEERRVGKERRVGTAGYAYREQR